MEPIEFFENVRRQRRQVLNQLEELEECSMQARSVHGVTWGEMARHGVGVHGELSDKLIRIEEKRAAVAALISRTVETMERAARLIEHISNVRVQTVFYYRYMLGYPWREVMKILGMKGGRIHSMKRQGLKEIENYITKERGA